MSIDTANFQSSASAVLRQGGVQMLVPPAMLIAASAMGVASHLHLGLSGETATAAGVALFCLMLMCHVLLRVADEAERAEDEAAERGIELVASPMPAAPVERLSAWNEPHPSNASATTGEAPVDVGEAQSAAMAQPAVAEALANVSWDFRPQDLQRQPAGFTPVRDPTRQGASVGASVQSQPNPGSAPLDLGQMRPTHADHALQSASAPINREAERIDAILKRLATQIHAGAAQLPEASGAAFAITGPAMPGAVTNETGANAQPDVALSTAVDALRSTVEAMRVAMHAKPVEHEPVSPLELRIASVAEALHAERADVFLAPILGLADQQARHFEVSVQLRSATGEALDGRDIAAGAGLLPLLDALNVRHAAGFALKLERRGRDGAVFSNVASGSLESEQFVTDVAGRHAQGIADRLVLSFEQNQMRGLGPAQLASLGDLGSLGFRYALQGVADLDMDFEALQALGFEFVKLDAAVFLGGLRCNGAHIPASDICHHFEDLGLTVIVSGIQDATTREQMAGCGVVYGQGPLFGEPKPVPFVGLSGGIMAA